MSSRSLCTLGENRRQRTADGLRLSASYSALVAMVFRPYLSMTKNEYLEHLRQKQQAWQTTFTESNYGTKPPVQHGLLHRSQLPQIRMQKILHSTYYNDRNDGQVRAWQDYRGLNGRGGFTGFQKRPAIRQSKTTHAQYQS